MSRLSATLLLLVFLATGGLRGLDAALYHRDDGATAAGVGRLEGTDSPRTHNDRCVLGVELRGCSALSAG
ncbi:MAG TPA: hypothetical protein VG500_05800, partial [Gemmatimonadales bacterium]|nr:hypothetical protein [Gemmatimonadales bacterium]